MDRFHGSCGSVSRLGLVLGVSILGIVDANKSAIGGTKTWDGNHPTSSIEVTLVYFVPVDRKPLPDWKERIGYYRRRIELFHTREFQGQSKLKTVLHPMPLISQLTTAELRQGDADRIFFRTLQETASRLKFPGNKGQAFPILLVFSEINWRPLDDFYRLKPFKNRLSFEGTYKDGEHFPGASAGGARATYFAHQRMGWGLVSADGWRVPYRGSDCVVYHEGCGHTVGLPHPEPADPTVMSLGQYCGWLNESWLNKQQKIRLGWRPASLDSTPEKEHGQSGKPQPNPSLQQQITLFSHFRALPHPRVPRPGQPVQLKLDWPEKAHLESLQVRFQTAIGGPWVSVPQSWKKHAPATADLGVFERATPVSYRVDARLKDGSTAELWGYFQVRQHLTEPPQPFTRSVDLIQTANDSQLLDHRPSEPEKEIDLLRLLDPEKCWQVGSWLKESGKLLSPKRFGARLQVPYCPPPEYRLVLVVEPLDEPDGLILGVRLGTQRFVTLINYTPKSVGLSALENVDGRNVGNPTTISGNLLQEDRLSQVIVVVTQGTVTVSVDGRRIMAWRGRPERLSLSDYWKTPEEKALFIGAYNCRYRIHRMTLEPLQGQGERLEPKSAQ